MFIFIFKQFIVHLFFLLSAYGRVFFVCCSLNPCSSMSFCCVSIESGDDDDGGRRRRGTTTTGDDDDESDSDLLPAVDIIETVEWSDLSSSSPNCCR